MSTTLPQWPRIRRFAQFSIVGASGAVVDLGLTFALLSQTHYLLANTLGFLVAASWNFSGNWLFTYSRPGGRLRWQYLSFVTVRGLTFALRALVVIIGVELLGGPATVATIAGVAVASLVNFAGAEWIFGRASMDLSEWVNHIAHAVYSSRLREWLLATGLYNPIFTSFAVVMHLIHGEDRYTVRAADLEAELMTKQPTETVSVLHTSEHEADVLEDFAASIREDDIVLDVGANVGVYTALACQRNAQAIAIEPHEATANRCALNIVHNSGERWDSLVRVMALNAEQGSVQIELERDAAGAQRGTTTEGDEVRCLPGDSLPWNPTVAKIDVEGSEVAVLDGLSKTLSTSLRLVYVEVHNDGIIPLVRRRLRSAGFDIEVLQNGRETHLRAERADVIDDAMTVPAPSTRARVDMIKKTMSANRNTQPEQIDESDDDPEKNESTGWYRRQVIASAAGIATAGAAGFFAGIESVQAAPSGEAGSQSEPLLRTWNDSTVFVERTSDPSSPVDGELWYNSSA